MIYGYARISNKKQKIERQVRNILEYENKAVIIQETFTGTKFQGRAELDKLLQRLFEESASGLLTEANYMVLMTKYQQEAHYG